MTDEAQLEVSQQQMLLFEKNLELQKQELDEQSKKNRADESLEVRRIEAEQVAHAKNLDHAGKVLKAQVEDRKGVREFASDQVKRICIFLGLLVVLVAVVCGIAICMGESKVVFDALYKFCTYALTLLAGIGVDRVWINRKNGTLPSTTADSE